MEIKGKINQILPPQSGEGKNGTWKKQEIVIETTEGKYPKKVCISVWGDKIDEKVLQRGNDLQISFDIESREYNSRWYTECKAWKIEQVGASQAEQKAEPITLDMPKATGNDLPF